jgi:HlyD family secretion protein
LTVKTKLRLGIIIGAVVVIAGVAVFAFRGKIFAASSAKAGAADPVGVTMAKVTRADITSSVTASGQLQPNTIATIRPDSNMPTRKLVTILVKEGARVKADQALAQIDASGLDLDLKSAQANLAAQKAKLDNLKAKPAGLDLSQSEGDLTQAKINLDSAQQTYDNTKALADKDLASRNQLADAERQLSLTKARYEAAQLSYQNVKAQSQEDVMQGQEAAVAQADSDYQKARLVYDSATIRSPMTGIVAEINVNVGDLISPSTAMMTVVDADPMWLQAQVNENDMVTLKVGQPAVVTPSGYPDMLINGKVTQIDLHAAVQGNVSVFTTTIEVPNRDGKLLWGMNADAEISVLSLKGVLTLPTSAVRTSNGSSQVTIMDGGKLVSWDVQVGPSDGSKVQIVAGLDEGEEVAIQRKSSTTGTTANNQNRQQQGGPGGGDMGQIFRVLR